MKSPTHYCCPQDGKKKKKGPRGIWRRNPPRREEKKDKKEEEECDIYEESHEFPTNTTEHNVCHCKFRVYGARTNDTMTCYFVARHCRVGHEQVKTTQNSPHNITGITKHHEHIYTHTRIRARDCLLRTPQFSCVGGPHSRRGSLETDPPPPPKKHSQVQRCRNCEHAPRGCP